EGYEDYADNVSDLHKLLRQQLVRVCGATNKTPSVHKSVDAVSPSTQAKDAEQVKQIVHTMTHREAQDLYMRQSNILRLKMRVWQDHLLYEHNNTVDDTVETDSENESPIERRIRLARTDISEETMAPYEALADGKWHLVVDWKHENAPLHPRTKARNMANQIDKFCTLFKERRTDLLTLGEHDKAATESVLQGYAGILAKLDRLRDDVSQENFVVCGEGVEEQSWMKRLEPARSGESEE
ncbi:MAG: hypothetical protein Q9174_006917, partial [Haloplaca sp. 1 TL-2023]